jgi:hypothetical protein
VIKQKVMEKKEEEAVKREEKADQLLGEAQLAEEADQLLEGLGPRFTDWWGYVSTFMNEFLCIFISIEECVFKLYNDSNMERK